MPKKSWKELGIDALLICAGLMVMALGSALTYQADLGTSAIGTMVDGLHKVLGISWGTADITVSLGMLAVVFVAARDLLNIGTVISLFITGFSVDLWKGLLERLPPMGPLAVYIMYVLGLLFGALGTGFYIAVNSGISPYDAFIMTFYRLTGWQYKYASILVNFLLIVAGWLLGGSVGAGTVISLVAGGYLTQFFIKRSTRLLGRKAVLHN